MKTPEGCRVEFIKDVSEKDLEEAEEYIGTFLPQSYRQFLLREGRFRLIDLDGPEHSWYEMLHPKQSIERIQNEIDEFSEDQFGDEPEDLESARQWFSRIKRLFPFQYYSTYVSDFWCFYLDSSKGNEHFIINTWHDDYDLDFLEPGTTQVSVGPFDGYSFEGFVAWHLKMIEEDPFNDFLEEK